MTLLILILDSAINGVNKPAANDATCSHYLPPAKMLVKIVSSKNRAKINSMYTVCVEEPFTYN